MKRFIFSIVLTLIFSSAIAQKNNISSSIDTNVLEFAGQTMFRVQVQTDKSSKIIFPQFKDTITNSVELVEEYPLDTISTNPFTVEKRYLVTSFEDSLNTISPIPVLVNNDTLFTSDVQFYVKPFYIDSAKVAQLDTTQAIPIFGLKDILDAPLTFKEFWMRYGKFIIWGLIILALIPVIIWLIKRIKSKEPIKIFQKPLEPAHIIAYRKLKELKTKELAENGKINEYYSELTHIVRSYIAQRYNVYTLERTSSEILNEFEMNKILNDELFKDLRTLLNMADLAKFAKYKPTDEINTSNFELTENFVDKTKIEEEVKEEENSEKKVKETKTEE